MPGTAWGHRGPGGRRLRRRARGALPRRPRRAALHARGRPPGAGRAGRLERVRPHGRDAADPARALARALDPGQPRRPVAGRAVPRPGRRLGARAGHRRRPGRRRARDAALATGRRGPPPDVPRAALRPAASARLGSRILLAGLAGLVAVLAADFAARAGLPPARARGVLRRRPRRRDGRPGGGAPGQRDVPPAVGPGDPRDRRPHGVVHRRARRATPRRAARRAGRTARAAPARARRRRGPGPGRAAARQSCGARAARRRGREARFGAVRAPRPGAAHPGRDRGRRGPGGARPGRSRRARALAAVASDDIDNVAVAVAAHAVAPGVRVVLRAGHHQAFRETGSLLPLGTTRDVTAAAAGWVVARLLGEQPAGVVAGVRELWLDMPGRAPPRGRRRPGTAAPTSGADTPRPAAPPPCREDVRDGCEDARVGREQMQQTRAPPRA